MTKTYIKPRIKIVTIQANTILAGSEEISVSGSGNLNVAEGKGFSFFEEEEEMSEE